MQIIHNAPPNYNRNFYGRYDFQCLDCYTLLYMISLYICMCWLSYRFRLFKKGSHHVKWGFPSGFHPYLWYTPMWQACMPCQEVFTKCQSVVPRSPLPDTGQYPFNCFHRACLPVHALSVWKSVALVCEKKHWSHLTFKWLSVGNFV